MNNEMFQQIYDAIAPLLPEDWKKVKMLAICSDYSSIVKFFIKNNENVYHDCFSLNHIDENTIMDCLDDIDDILSKERERLVDNKIWYTLTFAFDNEGNFESAFGYDDVTETSVDFERKWKKINLN